MPPCVRSSSADDNEGWAAGDEGVIFHTIDGGEELGAADDGHACFTRAFIS